LGVSFENSFDQKEKIKEMRTKLEKQVAVGIWLQFIGHFIEVLGLYELLQLNEDLISEGDVQIASGSFIGTIGHLLEAIAVSSQIFTNDKNQKLNEQKLAVTGDSLVSLGAAIEVSGGLEILKEEETGHSTRLVP